jgi:hypothetical protein
LGDRPRALIVYVCECYVDLVCCCQHTRTPWVTLSATVLVACADELLHVHAGQVLYYLVGTTCAWTYFMSHCMRACVGDPSSALYFPAAFLACAQSNLIMFFAHCAQPRSRLCGV